jgi:DNA-binding NarL/FixJ family response regulator
MVPCPASSRLAHLVSCRTGTIFLLTNREFEIFKLFAAGKSTSDIASMLSLASTTISTHRNHILEKMGLSNNSELTRYAIANHIISNTEL